MGLVDCRGSVECEILVGGSAHGAERVGKLISDFLVTHKQDYITGVSWRVNEGLTVRAIVLRDASVHELRDRMRATVDALCER